MSVSGRIMNPEMSGSQYLETGTVAYTYNPRNRRPGGSSQTYLLRTHLQNKGYWNGLAGNGTFYQPSRPKFHPRIHIIGDSQIPQVVLWVPQGTCTLSFKKEKRKEKKNQQKKQGWIWIDGSVVSCFLLFQRTGVWSLAPTSGSSYNHLSTSEDTVPYLAFTHVAHKHIN